MALTIDPNMIVLNCKLDEEALGEEDYSNSNRTDSGYFHGELAPSDSHRTVFEFRGLSNREVLVAAENEESMIRLLSKFYSGSELRVYRNFPGDLTPFVFGTNDDGYSDVVDMDGSGESSFDWGDETMTRLGFSIEAVEVR